MIWLVSSWVNAHGEPVSFTTAGVDPDEVFRAHCESYDYHFRGADRTRKPDTIEIPAGEERARIESTIYYTWEGVVHGIFARRFTPEEDAKVEALRKVHGQRIKDALAAGRTQDAIDAQREMDVRVVRERGAAGRKAVTLMLAKFPQWTRWHEDDKERGIVRSDAPVAGC